MSAMVAFPTGAAGLPPANSAHMYDTASLNGGHSSSTSGCQSSQSGADEGVERSRSSSPISLGAFSNYIPKNGGQLIRNRIFVCGFGNNTGEEELRAFFEQYGNVKDVKVIADKTGSSKGYGFITFESEEEAKRIIKEEQNNNKLNFKDRTLNIGPAVKREVARTNTHLAAQLNHVLSTNGNVPELTAGPALFYQSPATLTQVVLPTATYPAIATAALPTIGIDSPQPALQYAAYANQTPFQYAVLGNQVVNYSTNPVYAAAPNSSPFVDQKYVQSVIGGSTECYGSNASTPQATPNLSQLGQTNSAYPTGSYTSIPHASMSQICAASNGMQPSSEVMYYGRHGGLAYQQPSQANSLSSLSSSVDASFPPIANGNGDVACPPAQHLESLPGGALYSMGKSTGGGDDVDLSQTLSNLTLGNTTSECSNLTIESASGDVSSLYQPAYPTPIQHINPDLVTAAAAAAAWNLQHGIYQQNLQNYAKMANGNTTFSKSSTQNQNAYAQQGQLPGVAYHIGNGSIKAHQNGSPINHGIRQAAFK